MPYRVHFYTLSLQEYSVPMCDSISYELNCKRTFFTCVTS